MSITLRGLDGEEECMIGKRQTAAVGQQQGDFWLGIGCSETISSQWTTQDL
jgi:hypothetical protein